MSWDELVMEENLTCYLNAIYKAKSARVNGKFLPCRRDFATHYAHFSWKLIVTAIGFGCNLSFINPDWYKSI